MAPKLTIVVNKRVFKIKIPSKLKLKYHQRTTNMIQLSLTLKMTTALVVKTLVTVNNSPIYTLLIIELIRFKEYYRMPGGGMSTFRLYFRALFGTFFLNVFLE